MGEGNLSDRRTDFKLEREFWSLLWVLKHSAGCRIPPLNASLLSLLPQTKERNKLEALKKKLEQEEERMRKMEEEKKKKQEELRRSAAPVEEESQRLCFVFGLCSQCVF